MAISCTDVECKEQKSERKSKQEECRRESGEKGGKVCVGKRYMPGQLERMKY